jgi:hypothetical protein
LKPVFQTKFNNEGNCFAACVASLLECDINNVPFLYEQETWEKYEFRLNEFLKLEFKLFLITDEYDMEKYQYFLENDLKDSYSIVSGDAERGFFHAVIYKNGNLAHDPHPQGKGLINTKYMYLFFKFFY